MISLVLLAAAAAGPHPAPLKTFNDWIVGCDNGRACQANSLFTEEDIEALSIVVTRGAGPLDPLVIALDSANLGTVAVAADGKRLPVRLGRRGGEVVVRAEDVKAFVEGVKPARRLTLLDAAGKDAGHVSLAGLNAALLYMDDQQKRLGTVTALVRGGSRPASAVPASPPLPQIAVPAVPRLAPKTLTRADLARIYKALECTPEAGDAYQPVHARLDAKTSLAIVPWPCDNGAYNYFAAAYLIDNAGKLTRAKFDAPTGMSPDDDGSLVNADWDEKLRLLTTYAKGRGLGDCGTAQTFAWDGTRFRLSEQAEMGECRGATDYITTWRARVVRR